MPPIHAVDAAVHELHGPPADQLRRWVTSANARFEKIVDDLRADDAADDYEPADLIRASEQLRILAERVGEARRLVDALAHNRLSRLPGARAEIDGVTYKADFAGADRTLKEPARKEIATRAWETLADWLVGPNPKPDHKGPPADGVIPNLDDGDRRFARLVLSVAAAQYGEAFSSSPRRTVLARGLDGDDVNVAEQVPWKIRVDRYETETTGGGTRPTITVVKPKEHHA